VAGCELSILLKSYWNKEMVKYFKRLVKTFNSSKVLLEHESRTKFRLEQKPFNSSKVLLELIGGSLLGAFISPFNSSKVLLELYFV